MIKPALNRQPWIHSAGFDGVWILAPAFVSLFTVALLPDRFKQGADVPLGAWVVLILLIDVSHVYSTLFRTYLDPQRLNQQKLLFHTVPIICYIAGVLLYSVDALLFWRLLAYLAVFHFVRQQYGFMRLYSRTDSNPKWSRRLDALTIYTATIYPIIWWHFTPGRNFSWFVEGDFIQIHMPWLLPFFSTVYYLLAASYIIKEIFSAVRKGSFNIPKNAVVAGTLVTWYIGIIHYNGDLVFTLLNVVSHGVPYMALIWILGRKETAHTNQRSFATVFFRKYGFVLFAAFLFVLAWLEEGLWDGFVWKEHAPVFAGFSWLPQISDESLLAFLIPLLALPQSTHYVLDGFIWRRNNSLNRSTSTSPALQAGSGDENV